MVNFVHRDTDLRTCGAQTIAVCKDVRVNGKFISTLNDPNNHKAGNLIATVTTGKVRANSKSVIILNDPAKPDGLCPIPGGPHCNPKAASASPNVRAGGG